ncbi:hypothetical protein BD770DRAFT_433103 [Pilaira anomala]|nr:hypothetical protein BD770DRAFT_433103 [Pilaira anomala]
MSSSNDITEPSPILIINNYPSAPTMTSSNTHISISSSTLEYNIKDSDSIEIMEIDDDPFTTLVLLSGLLVNNHIKTLLKSLGNSDDALQLIIDTPKKQQDQEEEYDDIASLSSTYPRNYPGHQSLVDDRGSRWSSAESFKSIELDPGLWHCWWGYKFWWSWLPCCMPGGCCDRGCIRLKRHKSKSKQGWQQQHY